MATVMGGLSYGIYFVAKVLLVLCSPTFPSDTSSLQRYITPLIAPPTPPQLTADKAAIDADFARAFALLDQLATDTAALQSAETARTQRLDTALGELESVISEFREGARRREEDGRRLGDEVRGLKELVPRALEAQGKEKDERLRELGGELRSLKTLVGNRIGGQGAGSGVGGVGGTMASVQGGSRPTSTAATSGMGGSVNSTGSAASGNGIGGTMASSTSPQPTPTANSAGSAGSAGMGSGSGSVQSSGVEDGRANSLSSLPDRASNASPFNRFSGRAAIPAWQMAASKKNQEGGEKKDTSESGTMAEPAAAAS